MNNYTKVWLSLYCCFFPRFLFLYSSVFRCVLICYQIGLDYPIIDRTVILFIKSKLHCGCYAPSVFSHSKFVFRKLKCDIFGLVIETVMSLKSTWGPIKTQCDVMNKLWFFTELLSCKVVCGMTALKYTWSVLNS